ncbi:cation:proton antiporter [Paenibacillus massiliensis]|uniref:cation:proton antiporter domain-containing protein n=1 Tax=Paenibacillus massiliensis TaxID=225917 RepID=UPI00046ED16F|nr:cation:proton antiporter [Paenibacillus massiliensis]
MNNLALLLMQCVLIISVVAVFKWMLSKMGQPGVIGEILAGITLGPSLLGRIFPDAHAIIFPAQSLGALDMLSQLGLMIFMFIIGMELNIGASKKTFRSVFAISYTSIIIPFFLGVGLSFLLYPSYAPANIPFLPFALFMGTGMSITAFPVLARILRDQKIDHTELGSTAMMCASIDDASAWCILAFVTATVGSGSTGGALITVLYTLLYIMVMLFVIRPLLNGEWLGRLRRSWSMTVFTVVLVILFSSSWMTEMIGIHAMFGAFLAGVIMPRNGVFLKEITKRLEYVSLSWLLPIFFVLTGLKTDLLLFSQGGLWLVTIGIILIAIIGKLGGAAGTGRLIGLSWKDSLSLGVLLNTRGLMELTVLNIGYDLGIISPEIFAAMVVMTLITTCMTGPALLTIQRAFSKDSLLSRHTRRTTMEQERGTY